MSTGSETGEIDGISGATVSARAFYHAIIQSARTVARALGLIDGSRDTATVDRANFEPLGWADLIAAKAVQGYDLQINALGEGGVGNVAAQNELYLALLTPASIGRNLVSRGLHKRFVSPQSPDDLVFLLMSRSTHSVIGKEVFETGTFDRIHVRQNGRDYALTRQSALYRYVPFLVAEGAPIFSEMGIFRVPAENGIETLKPWQLMVDLRSMDAAVDDPAQHALTYELPARFVLPPSNSIMTTPEVSPVQAAWQAQSSNITILVTALSVLTIMLILMQTLTRRVWLYRTARTAFLLFTLIWLGWIAGAQLSVINPTAWIQALSTSNGLELFLLDPLLVILTLFVVASFIIWGRGIFCGWLCPFGALQELLSLAARSLKLPQITLSHRTHRSLWPMKYVVLTAVVLSAFHASATLGAAAEVEPFKTAISLKFDRALPYVAYAGGVLVIGLFIERAFCRFLCPLGALMAIGGKLRLGNQLKRRAECGSPCQLCARRCPIQAIAPTGQINMDECFYCLDCQVIYQDAHICPPLISKRKRAVRPRAVKA